MFSIIKEKNLKDVITSSMDKDPLFYLIFMDSLEFLNLFTKDEVLYSEAGQIYVALFLIDIKIENDEIIIDKINFNDIEQILLTVNIHQDVFNKTSNNVNKIIYTVFDDSLGISYFENLINYGYVEDGLVNKLINSDFVKLLDNKNYKLLVRLDEKMNRVD